jgi:membrane protein DedA with SNARE-associated domain
MPSGAFLIATTAGSALWIVAWTVLGALLGRTYYLAAARWGQVSWLLLLVVVVCALGVGLWAWRRAHALASAPPRAGRRRTANPGHAPGKHDRE